MEPKRRNRSVDFWSMVDIVREGGDIIGAAIFDECWLWSGPVIKSTGYGRYSAHYTTRLSHRVAYENFYGQDAESQLVLHSCDERLCCNPTHLRLGNHEDNMQDQVERGRRKNQYVHKRTEQDLSYEEEVMLQDMYRSTKLTFVELGRIFQISEHAVKRAISDLDGERATPYLISNVSGHSASANECRFWGRVRISRIGHPVFGPANIEPCWIWKGPIGLHGYGTFGTGGRTCLAHRLSYEKFYGDTPGSMMVLHNCNQRACVNPHHLRLGTDIDNHEDRIRAGTACAPPMKKGEGHPQAKLVWSQVRAIRDKYNNGMSQRQLAAYYGVSKTNIADIVKFRIWIE